VTGPTVRTFTEHQPGRVGVVFGLSGLTQLLASTRAVPAGLGLASVVTRHPAALRVAGADSLGLWLFPAARLHDQLDRMAGAVLGATPSLSSAARP
jgi:hypothetical protein